VHSLAAYDLLVDVLRGRPAEESLRHRAFNVPLARWRRVLGFEGCDVPFDRALRAASWKREAPDALRRMLADASATSIRAAMLAHRQLTEIAAIAAASGVRVLVLKGAARVLAGETHGTRSIADVDLLLAPADAPRFHRALQQELGYAPIGPGHPHHLAVLRRAGSLDIDLHFRIGPRTQALDSAIWTDTRDISLDGHVMELPSATNMVLHVLEHGAALNWMGRYRLRDILDIASLFTADVAADVVLSHVRESPTRSSFETLLSAAHELEQRVPRPRRNAWRTVRRVSRARLALAVLPRHPRVAERVYRYVGVLAEGSPGTMVRAGMTAARRIVGAA
jgi:hypothetical protein